MDVIELHPTRCAICQTEGNANELYPANFDSQAFNPVVFSARRLPDRIHYRMVKCNTCGLVRSDPIADPEVLARLYSQSTFDYDEEVPNFKLTYGYYLNKLSGYGMQKGALLEVGCGNGFFLEEGIEYGFGIVRGIEPSAAAVAKANPDVRPHIICNIMSPGLFEPEQFDVISIFQVFDHIPDPGSLLDECFCVLKPGGLILCLNHNVEAISAVFLKARSPIIDIEHTYLYSPTAMCHIFEAHGLQVKRIGSVYNRYSLNYLARLMPLPAVLKRFVLALLKGSSVGRIRLSVPLGNMYLIAQKPRQNQ